jgi:hypothetical protein
MDGTIQGTASVVSGSAATLTITAPTTGTHTLTATYTGDANYLGSSTTSPVSITVSRTPTTIVVVPATTTPAGGSSLAVTATITPTGTNNNVLSGTVTITLDGATVATVPVTAGSTTVNTTITAPTSGTHTLQASYSGDANYGNSISSPVTLTVTKTATTTTIAPATITPTAGSNLQITATITPTVTGSVLPTGTVSFTLDGVTQGIEAVVSASPATALITVTVPASGTHTLAAVYSGDTNYAGSTASTITITVGKATPTVTLTPTPLNPTAGSNLQLSATIGAPASGGASPSGTVSFTVDGVAVGTGLVVSGSPSTASLTINTPALGPHTLVATYSGDANYIGVTSQIVTITVTKSATTLAVIPSSTAPYGNSTMLVTATIGTTITGSTVPTGTVTFLLDGATVGSGAVVGGANASTTITVPATGTHTLQASYSGDSNYLGAVSPTASFTVAKTPVLLTVTPSTTTPALGSTLPVTATITPTITGGATLPTGTVTFTLDGVTAGVEAVVSGSPASSSFTFPALAPGAHTIGATYSGDGYYASAIATPASITVPKSPTTIADTPATVTPTGGSSLLVSSTITATTPGTTLPTGTVTYSLDGASVGIEAVVPGSPSTATITIPAIAPGTHILQATYSGDSYYASSAAQAITLTVSKSPTTIVLIPSTLTPTAGGSMLVTANISSSSPSTTLPTGTVVITLDGIAVATGTVVPGSPAIAAITIPLVSAGTHVLAGSYSGDTYYTPSNSPTVTIVAAKGTTTTTLVATPPTLSATATETLTATIAPTTAVTGTTYTLTGTVTFYDGTTLLGQAAVTNNTGVLTGVKLKDNVSHTLTAVYSGDSNWIGSTSTPLPLDSITLPDFVVLTSNFSTVQPGMAVVLTATVTPSAPPATTGEQNPTGTVVFYNGTTIIGQAVLTPVALGDTSTATLTTSTLPGGTDTVSAVYMGDLSYDQATSNLLTLTIEGFTITPASTNPPTNLNIVLGGAGSESFVVTGEGGFNNEVQVICTVPSQDDMACTASPQQVTPTGVVTFVIQTYVTGGPTANVVLNHGQPIWQRVAGGTALAVLGFFFVPFGRRARAKLLRGAGRHSRRLVILLLLLVGLAGAGIGCTSTTGVSNLVSGTPLGVSTLQVTATAYVNNTVVSQSINFTVNVTAAP